MNSILRHLFTRTKILSSSPCLVKRYIFVTSLSDSGPTRVVSLFLNYQRDINIEWTVVYFRKCKNHYATDLYNKFNTVHISTLVSSLILASCSQGYKWQCNDQPIIFFSHGLVPDIFAHFLNKINVSYEIALVTTMHNAVYDDYYLRWSLAGSLIAFGHCMVLKNFHKIIVCSDWLYRYYYNILQTANIISISNAVECLPIEYCLSILSKCLLYPDCVNAPLTCITASRLIPRKNLSESISFFSMVHRSSYIQKNYPVISYNIAGDGPLAKYLSHLISEENPLRINLLGKVAVPRLDELMINSDIYISSSLSEGSPLGVLEAFAYGCCILLSNIPAHQDIFNQAKSSGFVFTYEVGSFDSFLISFEACIEVCRVMPRAERITTARQYFSPQKMALRYHEVLSLLQNFD